MPCESRANSRLVAEIRVALRLNPSCTDRVRPSRSMRTVRLFTDTQGKIDAES
jgi:hypothetical protein